MQSLGLIDKWKPAPNDLLASVVVFLVALPLCMGISIASGAPPISGLIAGVIGGLVVGILSGSPLQASGPAAGLAVIVYQMIQQFGFAQVCVITMIAGLIQAIGGIARVGHFFRAVSPALISGMLAGIGILIFASQFHVMIDHTPLNSGIDNILAIPSSTAKALFNTSDTPHHIAALIGLLTLVSIIGWTYFKPKQLKAIPGALIGIMLASVICAFYQLPIQYVTLPDNIMESLQIASFASFTSSVTNIDILLAALTVAAIASAESLLCSTAVSQMKDGPKIKYNKELFAQGIGNFLSGAVGGLPITGVIVRSTANIEAGAETRLSTVLHGIWLLLFVSLFSSALEYIPMAGLAAILVYTGFKLVNVKELKQLWFDAKSEFPVYLVTILGVVCIDLLTGVVAGFVLSVCLMVRKVTTLNVSVEKSQESQGGEYKMRLAGSATFLGIKQLSDILEDLPKGSSLDLDSHDLTYIDHACLKTIRDTQKSKELKCQGLENLVIKRNLRPGGSARV